MKQVTSSRIKDIVHSSRCGHGARFRSNDFAVYFSWIEFVLLVEYKIEHFSSVLSDFARFFGQNDTEMSENITK